jgi:hypothetical protein
VSEKKKSKTLYRDLEDKNLLNLYRQIYFHPSLLFKIYFCRASKYFIRSQFSPFAPLFSLLFVDDNDDAKEYIFTKIRFAYKLIDSSFYGSANFNISTFNVVFYLPPDPSGNVIGQMSKGVCITYMIGSRVI